VRRLTDAERCALRPFGPPGEGPVPDSVFEELERLGWGRWVETRVWRLLPFPRRRTWEVTTAGARALDLDTLARQVGP
jgi:hypothetical protein